MGVREMNKKAIKFFMVFILMIGGTRSINEAQGILPDLTVHNVKLKDCYVIITIANLGGSGFPSHREGQVNVRFLQSGKDAGSWSYNVLYAPRLQKKGGKLTFTVNKKMIEGTMEVLIHIDPDNRILELNENNNKTNRSFTCKIQKFIQVLTPNGGEKWDRGKEYSLSWKKSGFHWEARVNLYLKKEGEFEDTKIPITETDIGDSPKSIYQWTIPDDFPGGYFRLFVDAKNSSVRDGSDKTFYIDGPFIRVLSPNGGERWTSSAFKTIRWTSHLVTDPVKIMLYAEKKPIPPVVITPKTDNTGRITFTPNNIPDGPYYIEISTLDGKVKDFSDQSFTVQIGNQGRK